MEELDPSSETESSQPEPVKFYLNEVQINFLLDLKNAIIVDRAYQVLEWEASNLAVVAAADGFSRGKLDLIDLILNSAVRVTN